MDDEMMKWYKGFHKFRKKTVTGKKLWLEKNCDWKKTVTGKKVHLELALTRAKNRYCLCLYTSKKRLTSNLDEHLVTLLATMMMIIITAFAVFAQFYCLRKRLKTRASGSDSMPPPHRGIVVDIRSGCARRQFSFLLFVLSM